MGIEIERKFLLRDTSMLAGREGAYLSQGYLSHTPEATVRVRISGEQAFLTVKGRNQGARRAEFEYPIPVADATALLMLCPGGHIEKTRYRIPVADLVWEVDVFHGANTGLIVAEVELPDEHTPITLPAWAGEEVTDDPRYYNSALSLHPFRDW